MSVQGSWCRRSSPKPGPLKATLPMSSLTRAGILTENSSPSSNQPFKLGLSPETGLRSPGAVNYKGKSEAVGAGSDGGQHMRRTASLDTIYLRGHWPRESLYLSNLQVDRSTQTEDWLSDPRKALRHQDSANEDKLEKLIRNRMQRTKEGSSRERTAAFSLLGGDSHISHKHRMRSSIEGLNQEIERLVLRSTPSLGGLDREERKTVESTPEGHRAPVADLLRETRSVNTQTPAFTAPSSGPPSQNSPSGRPVSNLSDSRPSSELLQDVSEDSSPEQEGRGLGTSPRINKFLAREPPDGCERVSTRLTEDRRPMVDISEVDYPLKPSMNFQLKPSLGSAFQPLRSTQ